MSNDGVDDLHYAEDLLGGANLLGGYCRPTCGYLDEGECQSGGEEDGCGCPCGHEPPFRDKVIELAESFAERLTAMNAASAELLRVEMLAAFKDLTKESP